LKQEYVDIFLGNHTWNNQTKENYEKMLVSQENPFIDHTKWVPFLEKCEANAEAVILRESRESFVNYAHRGASTYAPENTFLAFYTGIYMGANGIETDVKMTKDGVLVLFHDSTVTRLTGAEGSVSDYTLEEHVEVDTLPVKSDIKTERPVRSTLSDICAVIIVNVTITVNIHETYITRSCIRLKECTVSICMSSHLIRILEDSVCLMSVEIWERKTYDTTCKLTDLV
jgi:hypothetical protein